MAISNLTRPFAYPEKVSVPQPIINVKDLSDRLKGILKDELLTLLPDFKDDLALLAQDIAPILISATLAGDTKLKAEVEAQLGIIADIYKIRGSAEVWKIVKQVSGIALQVLAVGLAAVTKV